VSKFLCLFVQLTSPRRRSTEEDKKLLITTIFKCQACVDPPQDNFRDWVLHQLEAHQLDLGYGDADLIRSRPDLMPRIGLKRPCPECGKMLRNNHVMLSHIKSIHLRQLPFSCDFCGKKFSRKQALKGHIEACHSTNLPRLMCTLCGSTFKTRS